MAKSARKTRPAIELGKGGVVVPTAEDLPIFEGTAEPLDVDAEAHLRWLETGEGEPWPPVSSS
jgi:hypothetical protein